MQIPWHKWEISDRLDMLNPMSVLIVLNPICRELQCWGCACLDSYLSPRWAQHPEQTELVPDNRGGLGAKNCCSLHWMCVQSSALLKAKLTCGLTQILHLMTWERENALCRSFLCDSQEGFLPALLGRERILFWDRWVKKTRGSPLNQGDCCSM